MLFLYNLGIRLYGLLIQLACLNSAKARFFVKGRSGIFERIEDAVSPGKKHIWFHFASLGEFEQGRPVLEEMRKTRPESSIFVTFFSPSGYEIRKNYPLADHIFYLPVDTKDNARRFIDLVNPEMAVFTKYEYWYHYFTGLESRNIPLYVISGIFRRQQPFFKWYGGFHRKMLNCVSYFFVQNPESQKLLAELNHQNVIVSGDTRFDRVYENAHNPKKIDLVEAFCGDSKVIIAGSTWLPDEKLLTALPALFPDWKLVIAPHEIGESRIKEIESMFEGSVRFSRLKATAMNQQTLIIDNIGMLSSLYQYGDIACIGGGFGAGIHNTLEAAAFGLPVIFGPKYEKFQEAKDLIQAGAAFPVSRQEDLRVIAGKLILNDFRITSGAKARHYVEGNTGATALIVEHINFPIN